MKYILFFLCFFPGIAGFGQTKEETVEYLNRVVNEMTGEESEAGLIYILSSSFTYDRVAGEFRWDDGSHSSYSKTGIDWSTCIRVECWDAERSQRSTIVKLTFEKENIFFRFEHDDIKNESYTNIIVLQVPREEVENVKKAINRLIEISRSEK